MAALIWSGRFALPSVAQPARQNEIALSADKLVRLKKTCRSEDEARRFSFVIVLLEYNVVASQEPPKQRFFLVFVWEKRTIYVFECIYFITGTQ